ncbi:MAG TPA: YggT family protein [Acidimicrobiales bacterium]|nr:YggT family protein [Acidimicrobiales bacterium]
MQIVCLAIQLYLVAIFARIVLSFFPLAPGTVMSSIFSTLYTVTEPVLGPVRRVLPPIGGGGIGIDLSPMIVVFAVQLLVLPMLGCGRSF